MVLTFLLRSEMISTMKLYIPSLGDRIQLTKDWTFNLHHESRNSSLGKLFKLIGTSEENKYEEYMTKVHSSRFDSVSEKIYTGKIIQPEYWLNGKIMWHHAESPYGHINEKGEKIKWCHNQDQDCFDSVCLKKDSVLKTDRIYIRKGQQTFDSITFTLESSPDFKKVGKKSLARFWVKLKDANNIEFESL